MASGAGEGFEIRHLGDVTAIRFTDRTLTAERIIQLWSEKMCQLAGSQDSLPLLLDLKNVDCLSSSGLGALLFLHKRIVAAGGRLSICNLHPETVEAFKITGFDRLIRIVPDPGDDGDMVACRQW